MSSGAKPLILVALLIGLIVCGTSLLLLARAASTNTTGPVTSNALPTQRTTPRGRNLALQPEAFRLSQRLGKRFTGAGVDAAELSATLTIGSNRQSVSLVRRQSDTGERVEVTVDGSALSWSATEGARSSGGVPTLAERTLIERLALDSADQFVLAQLRGAAYYTVLRHVMADDGSAVWNVVRIDDPEPDEARRPLNRWRLYYLNIQTELVDKVVYESGGVPVETIFSNWLEQGGEKTPGRIRWLRQGQVVMELTLTSLSLTTR